MAGPTCLNNAYSTTRLATNEIPIISDYCKDKFESVLFLPKSEGRKGEGGLRTKNYFKTSHINKPLITVITVVFNGEKHLEETILSVINQSYDNVEYIIIDGGSTDGTLSILRKYEEQIDYWVSEPDQGIYDAMNKGIQCSLGEAIGIINSDDWYESNAISQIVSAFNGLFSSIVHGDMNIYKDDKLYYKSNLFKSIDKITKGMIINHPTTFVGMYLYKKYGFFSTKYKIASDWDLMLRLYKARVPFTYIPQPIANFRLGGASYNVNTKAILEKHVIRSYNKAYKVIDYYFMCDYIKLLLFGKYLSKASILRQKYFSK